MRKRKERFTEKFWTKKGVKQGCVMNPFLFNLYMAEIEEELRNKGIGEGRKGILRMRMILF